MKFVLPSKITRTFSLLFDDGCKALRERAELASQTLCVADDDHDEHEEEIAPTIR